ncbi:MAG: hypothetical protein WD076_04305 [Parvularculaceae bacterium]
MIRFCAAAAASAAAAVSVSSAQELARGREMISNVSLEAVQPVLSEAGFTVTPNLEGKAEFMLVEYGGRKLILGETVCEAANSCDGLVIFGLLTDTAGTDVVNDFNSRQNPARAVATPDNVVIDHYIMADYGMVRGSLVVNVGVMFNMIDRWFEFRRGVTGANTISYETVGGGVAHQDPRLSALTLQAVSSLSADPSLRNGSKIDN